jgi:uncharacterized repeat protein (TIGR01451 family)
MGIIRRLLVLSLFVAASAFGQSADQEVVSVVDSPDPVTPGATLTYTITLRNNGPDPATNGGFNVSLPGQLTYQNTVAPAGFTCSALGSNVSCTAPSFAAGSTVVFTMTATVASSLISFPDGTFSATFSPSGTTADPTPGNNSKTATTTYNTPQINMALSVTDAPDPVAPDGNITYTVNVGNSGPDAAQNATFNTFNNGSLQFQSATVPAGWNCTLPAVNSTPTFTCTHPTSYAAGTNEVFTVVVRASKAILGVNDGTVSTFFGISGTGNETNTANDSETENTTYDAPSVDMQITATDSPDPVAPDGNITYTVSVKNAGPDTATNATMSVVLNNTLRYQSITVPAGWSCPSLAVGHGASFTCTASTLASGATSVFTVVLNAGQAQFGVSTQTINETFTTGSDWADPNNANNAVTVSTTYATPSVDMQITATDSPDPVAPDGNITYTVNVKNAGPDTAKNATMSVVLNNTLRYQSITVPAGWSCPSLAVGHGASFTCTAATLASGVTSVFTVVLNAGSAQFGNTDQTINQVFTTGNDWADPNNANNSVTVPTSYVAPKAEMAVTATDSPDPVSPNGNITYAITVTNNGPNTATNATLNVPLNNTLLFQSMTVPAGWSCATPAVNAGTSFSCTASTMTSATTANFSLVLKAAQSQFGNTNQTITQNFSVSSAAFDTNNANNNISVSTAYVVPVANLGVTNSDAPDPVTSGGVITYTQTLTNAGPNAATNAHITELVPSGTTFQSIAAPAGFSCTTPAVGGTGTITCTTASMTDGASATFTLVVNVTATSGSISDTVLAASDTSDGTTSNDSATATTAVLAPPSANLGITKTTATTNAGPGSAVSYTVVVTNGGPDATTAVTMTDTLPASLRFASITSPAGFTCTTPAVGASGTITCTGTAMANAATASFTLGVTVASGASGSISNTASVSGAPADPSSGNNSATATFTTASADLSLTGSVNKTGALITYTFTAGNAGPNAASNVVFTDALPSSLRFQSVNAPGFTCTTPAAGVTGTITCNAPSMAAGANATLTIVTTAAPGTTGNINNPASITSATFDPNPNNGTATPPSVTAPVAEEIPALSMLALLALAGVLAVGALMRMR